MAAERFVLVNRRILDFDKYKKECSMLSRIIMLDMMEYFKKIGFKSKCELRKNFTSKFNGYNSAVDLEIMLVIKKKHKTEFV